MPGQKTTLPRQLLSALFIFALLVVESRAMTVRPSQQEKPQPLETGQVIERQLNGGETQVFQVLLAAGQYLCVEVEQRGIDVELKLASPAKQTLVETDALNSTQGPEVAAILATEAGLHHVEVVSPSKGSLAGTYQIKILALRTVTESDRLWLSAQQFYLEGKQLSGQSTAAAQEQAVQKFADALRIWQVQEDRLMVAHTLAYLVELYRDRGQTQHALVYSGYALELLRAIQQPREEATALMTLAIILNELGELPKARDYYQLSLMRWRSFRDTYGEARTLVNLGLVNSQLGEPQVALDNYNEALAVWQRLGNRFQEAETLTRIGRAYYRLSEWQKSLSYASQAQALYRALENKRGEATVFNNIGLVYEKLGEAGKALDYHNQSLAMWRSLGNRREEAETLSSIGQAQAQQQLFAQALASYQSALKLWREAGDRRGEAFVLQLLGDLQATTGESQAALGSYNQALPLLRTTGDSYREANVLMSIANLCLAKNDPAKAQEFLTSALAILQSIGNRADEAKALFGLARTARALGNLSQSQQQIEAALAKAEAARTSVGSQQLRASYLASIHSLYEFNQEVLMQLHHANPNDGYDGRAVQASERARARSLLEQLAESSADIRQGVDAGLLARERELAQLLNAKAQTQSQLSQRANDKQWRDLQREIRQLENEYQQVQASIRQTSPHYAALIQPQPLGLAEIQSLLDADTLLLEYALGEERSYLWAISASGLRSYELPKRSQIESVAKQFSKLLNARAVKLAGETVAARNERIAQADAQLSDVAKQLSNWLLAPAAGEFGDKRLVIVPDGALQYVPFAALTVPNSSKNPQSAIRNPQSEMPLVVKHELVTLPSASTLAVMRKELAGRASAPRQLAIFADPVFGSEDNRLKSKLASKAGKAQDKSSATPTTELVAAARSIVHEDSGSTAAAGKPRVIPRLPFTRQEAERILAVMPDSENLKAIDFSANRALATGAELGQYRYLHFATHGVVDTERAGLSALLLSLVDENGNAQDGFLRAHEIYNLKLPAELVVLSACQTGLGKEYKGEGLVGLTRGFMYAGAARVVVSLWNVNDRATSELMARFYQKMLPKNGEAGQRPAAALRSAQVEMWKQRQWSAPYFWAAFVLQGEWK